MVRTKTYFICIDPRVRIQEALELVLTNFGFAYNFVYFPKNEPIFNKVEPIKTAEAILWGHEELLEKTHVCKAHEYCLEEVEKQKRDEELFGYSPPKL